MCFALTNTSPWISENRVPTISRGAEGQWRSEIAEKGTEEFVGSIQCDIRTEELPPQHTQYLYYTAETQNNREAERQNGEHSRETMDDKWMSKTYGTEDDDQHSNGSRMTSEIKV